MEIFLCIFAFLALGAFPEDVQGKQGLWGLAIHSILIFGILTLAVICSLW